MMRILSFLVFLTLFSISHGYFDFTNIKSSANAMFDRLSELMMWIKVQESKFPPTGNTSIPQMENLNLPYSTIANDMETRMLGLESQFADLVANLSNCGITSDLPPPENITVATETVGGFAIVTVDWDPPVLRDSHFQYNVYFIPLNDSGEAMGNGVVFNICDKNQTKITIMELPANQKYAIKVATVDGPQFEGFGDPIVLKTLDVLPAAPIIDYAESYRPNEIFIRFKRGVSNATVLYFVVFYTADDGKTYSDRIDATRTNYTLTDLTESGNYTIFMAAASDNGLGDKSAMFKITTLPFIPQPPSFLDCKTINSSAIALKWSRPPVGFGATRVLTVVTHHRGDILQTYNTTLTGPTNTIVTGLNPSRSYFFDVVAYTRHRAGPRSGMVHCRTAAEPPDPPQNIQFKLWIKEPPKYVVSFRPPAKGQNRIEGYEVHWGVRDGAVRKEVVNNRRLTWESDFLDENTPHTFKFFTRNDAGLSRPAIITRTTPASNVTSPKNVTVSRNIDKKTNKTTLMVQWKEPSLGEECSNYRVLYRPFAWVYYGRWTLKNVTGENTSVVIPLKDHNSSYIVVVRCVPMKYDRRIEPYNPPFGRNDRPPYIDNHLRFNNRNNRNNIDNTNNQGNPRIRRNNFERLDPWQQGNRPRGNFVDPRMRNRGSGING